MLRTIDYSKLGYEVLIEIRTLIFKYREKVEFNITLPPVRVKPERYKFQEPRQNWKSKTEDRIPNHSKKIEILRELTLTQQNREKIQFDTWTIKKTEWKMDFHWDRKLELSRIDKKN